MPACLKQVALQKPLRAEAESQQNPPTQVDDDKAPHHGAFRLLRPDAGRVTRVIAAARRPLSYTPSLHVRVPSSESMLIATSRPQLLTYSQVASSSQPTVSKLVAFCRTRFT